MTHEILVFPVSGGGFVTQLSFVCQLLDNNPSYRPTVMMGSSGGNIAAYITALSDCNPSYIRETACQLSHHEYIKTERAPLMTRLLFGRKNLYTPQDKGLIQDIMVEPVIKDYEIWTGCFNNKESKAALFCNLGRHDSLLHFDRDKYGTSPAIYVDGDIETIHKIARATTSIPILLPPVNINGRDYTDGGGRYASPISSLRDQVSELGWFHLIYISSENLDYRENQRLNNLISIAKNSLDEILRGAKIQDRQVARDLTTHKQSVSISSFDEYFELRNNYQRTVLEVHPNVPNDVDILTFEHEDVKNCFALNRHNMVLRMWF